MNEKQMSKLYKVFRFNINEFKYDKGLNIYKHYYDVEDKKLIRKHQTLLKEPELIRIIRSLNLTNNDCIDDGFIAVKDIISIKTSSKAHRKIIKSDGVVIVNDIKFKRLLSSTGNIRNSKIIFVKEDLFDKVNKILLCGMPEDMEFDYFSKFNAYYALVNTDSTAVTMPRMVVIKDFEKKIKEPFDIVKEIKQDVYQVINNETNYTEKIKPFDGAGLCDMHWASKVAMAKLKLDYLPSAFQFRAIPGIKGNLYTFDIGGFAREKGITSITDAWGKEWDIFDRNGNLKIDAILTVSQFKFFKKYKNYDEWLKNFKTVTHGYRRTFNISKYADKFEDIKDKALLSYQPLQSLNLGQKQIEILCADTIKTMKEISTNVDSFLKYRGLLDDVEENSNDKLVPDYYKALKQNKALFHDDFIQSKIQKDLKNFKERIYRGAVFIPANYQTFIPDLIALAEYSMGIEVKGCLNAYEVYSKYWLEKGVNEVDIIRFPHVANEHVVAKVVNPNNKYLKYITEGIITSSTKDTTALKLNSADFDNDHILTNCSRVLIQQAKTEKSNTIIYVKSYEDNKENDKKDSPRINSIEKVIETDCNGMSNNIGKVINKISILWSLPQAEEVKDFIKIMSIVGSKTIDFVKTGIPAKIPKDIAEFLKDKKKPDFMRYKYKKQSKNEKNINKNNKILEKDEIELFNKNDCTMNRVCTYMQQQIDDIGMENNNPSIFDFLVLMNNVDINIRNSTYPKILRKLIKLKAEYDEISQKNIYNEEDYSQDKKQENEYKYKIFYNYCRAELLKVCKDIDKLLDYLVNAFYCDKEFAAHNHDKSILWNTFGKELNYRLQDKEHKELPDMKISSKKLNDRVKKLKKEISKIKEDNKKVKIKLFETSDTSKKKFKVIEIYESELDYLNDKIRGIESRKMAYTLIVLDKFCKAYEKEFLIFNGKRNVINKNQICKLSEIDSKKYELILQELNKNSDMIKLDDKEVKEAVIKCTVDLQCQKTGKVYRIKDINDSKKYLKKVS